MSETLRKYRSDFSKESGTKSVMSPSAQFSGLLHPGTDAVRGVDYVRAALGEASPYLGNVYDIALIMLYGACRVSEVLKIRWKDVLSGNRVYIHSLKKGRNRIVVLPEPLKSFLWAGKDNEYVYDGVNRHLVYRRLKACGFVLNREGHKNSSVTHMFRHYVADEVRGIDNNEGDVSSVLYHSGNNSSKYYYVKK
jgi:integrase